MGSVKRPTMVFVRQQLLPVAVAAAADAELVYRDSTEQQEITNAAEVRLLGLKTSTLSRTSGNANYPVLEKINFEAVYLLTYPMETSTPVAGSLSMNGAAQAADDFADTVGSLNTNVPPYMIQADSVDITDNGVFADAPQLSTITITVRGTAKCIGIP